ncbi:MAG: YybH family protein [Nitritalea sp.]
MSRALRYSLWLLLGLGVMAPLFAQQADKRQEDADRAAIEALLQELFAGMKAKDAKRVAPLFHAEANMQTVALDEVGAPYLGPGDVAAFLKRIAETPEGTVLDEQLTDIHIRLDGPLAHAWTPYRFYVSGNFSHCGVNSFQLIKEADRWQIVHVLDTRRAENCDEIRKR